MFVDIGRRGVLGLLTRASALVDDFAIAEIAAGFVQLRFRFADKCLPSMIVALDMERALCRCLPVLSALIVGSELSGASFNDFGHHAGGGGDSARPSGTISIIVEVFLVCGQSIKADATRRSGEAVDNDIPKVLVAELRPVHLELWVMAESDELQIIEPVSPDFD